MGKSTDILPMPEALPGLGVHGVVFHNGKGYYYTCKEYCSSIEKRTYECVKPDCKGTANIRSLGSSMVEICRHNHAPDFTYRNKCVVFHLIQQRFIEEHGSPVDILQDIMTSLAETLDTNTDSNLQEDTVGNSTNVVKSSPVTPKLSDKSRKSRKHSLRRCNSSGRLTEETQSQSSEILETPVKVLELPADCLPTENDDHSSDDGFEAQVGNSTNVVKSNVVGLTPTVADRSRKRTQHSLGRSSSSGRLTEETTPVKLLELPADSVPTENDDHSSDDGSEAQSTKSLPDFKPTTGTAPAQPASSGDRKRRSLRSIKKTPATEEEQPCSQPTTSQTQSPLRESDTHNRIENENYFSDDNFDAQDDDSSKNDDEFDTDPEYTPSSKRKKDNESSPVVNDSQEDVKDEDVEEGSRKKCNKQEFATNQQNESVSIPILIEEVKSEIEIVDTIATNFVEPSTSRNQTKELPALLSVLGLEQLVDHQQQSGEVANFENDQGDNETFPRRKQKNKIVQKNRYTWSREAEIRAAIAEGRNYYGPIEFYLSPKEKVNITMDGYSYRHKGERDSGSSRWACTMKHCKSILELDANMGFTIEKEHLCQKKDFNNIELKKAKYIIKKRVAEETTKIATIYKEEMAKLMQRGIKVPTGGASAHISNCYNYRKKLIAAGEYRPMDGINISNYLEHGQDYE